LLRLRPPGQNTRHDPAPHHVSQSLHSLTLHASTLRPKPIPAAIREESGP
jgi:hypothetical protein